MACGLVSLAEGWTVAVLPKAWWREKAAVPTPDHSIASLCNGRLNLLVLHQGQTVLLDSEVGAIGELAGALRKHLEDQEDESAEIEYHDDDDEIEEADRKRVRNLLVPHWRKSNLVTNALPPVQGDTGADSEAERRVAALLNLLLWAVPSALRHHLGHQRNPLLTPWLEKLFVDELVRRLPYLRRGYVPTTEDLGVLRGRVDPASAKRALVSVAPELRCHFDEFTEAIPHFRALVTALDLVGTASSPLHVLVSQAQRGRFESGVKSTAGKARHLRFLLSGLRPLPTAQAIATARMPLPLHFRKLFQDAVDLALALLARQAPVAATGMRANPDLAVNTATIFEKWIEFCFAQPRSSTGRAWRPLGAQPRVQRLWTMKPKRHQRADLVCECDEPGRRLLVDCKFKVLEVKLTESNGQGGKISRDVKRLTAPPIADLRQVFAYAKAGLEETVDSGACSSANDVLLVYLSPSGESCSWSDSTPESSWVHRVDANELSLRVVAAAFPRESHFLDGGLEDNLTKLAESTKESLCSAS